MGNTLRHHRTLERGLSQPVQETAEQDRDIHDHDARGEPIVAEEEGEQPDQFQNNILPYNMEEGDSSSDEENREEREDGGANQADPDIHQEPIVNDDVINEDDELRVDENGDDIEVYDPKIIMYLFLLAFLVAFVIMIIVTPKSDLNANHKRTDIYNEVYYGSSGASTIVDYLTAFPMCGKYKPELPVAKKQTNSWNSFSFKSLRPGKMLPDAPKPEAGLVSPAESVAESTYKVIRDFFYSVRVDVKDAEYVAKLLSGPIMKNYEETTRVATNVIKEEKISKVLDLWAKGYQWTEEEYFLIQAGALTDGEWNEKLVEMRYKASETNTVKYGVFVISRLQDGKYRLAYANYKANFELAPIKVETQEVNEFFNGWLEFQGNSEEKALNGIGANTVNRLNNYFRTQALKSLRADGVLTRPIESYDVSNPALESQQAE